MDEQLNVFDYIQSQMAELINDSVKPDSRSVQTLIRQVARYVRQHQQVDGFCGGDAACKSCAKTYVAYEANWKKYVQFYRDKMTDLWYSSLGCQYELAVFCKSHLKEEVLEQKSKREKLYNIFNYYLNANVRPTRWQMKGMAEESTQFERKHNGETSISLCNPDSSCQSCLEHNVNCWNSNPNYLNSKSWYCKTPFEWRLIKYKPTSISTNCGYMTL